LTNILVCGIDHHGCGGGILFICRWQEIEMRYWKISKPFLFISININRMKTQKLPQLAGGH
jgi:hypothetical protein